MATTLSSQAGFGALVQELVQAQALEELRARAVHAMPGLYVPGRFVKGTNVIRYARYADLSINTTPLTEGAAPVDDALTISSEFFLRQSFEPCEPFAVVNEVVLERFAIPLSPLCRAPASCPVDVSCSATISACP